MHLRNHKKKKKNSIFQLLYINIIQAKNSKTVVKLRQFEMSVSTSGFLDVGTIGCGMYVIEVKTIRWQIPYKYNILISYWIKFG